MAKLIETATVVAAAGSKPKRIEEYIGRLNSGTGDVRIARMTSPAGWLEPGQTPELDEYTLVLEGTLRVETRTGTIDVGTGQAVHAPRGEWVRYSTAHAGGASYVAVCVPAFSPERASRRRGRNAEPPLGSMVENKEATPPCRSPDSEGALAMPPRSRSAARRAP